MKLYLVQFEYFNLNGEDVVEDCWLIGAANIEEVDTLVKMNMKELEKNGYEPIHYKVRLYDKTDNDFKINLIK